MPKQKIEIEVDIPDEYEATGEYRLPLRGEHFLASDGHVYRADFNYMSAAYPIVQKAWQWPEWLKAPYIAMSPTGWWYAYRYIPFHVGDDWSGDWEYLDDDDILNFTPPACDDWRESLRKNPNL